MRPCTASCPAADSPLFFSERAPLSDADSFTVYLNPLRNSEWVVYAKPPFEGPHQVLAYLGRYNTESPSPSSACWLWEEAS